MYRQCAQICKNSCRRWICIQLIHNIELNSVTWKQNRNSRSMNILTDLIKFCHIHYEQNSSMHRIHRSALNLPLNSDMNRRGSSSWLCYGQIYWLLYGMIDLRVLISWSI